MIVALVLNLLLFWFVTVLISQNHGLKIIEFVLWVVVAHLLGGLLMLVTVGLDGPGWARSLVSVASTSLVLAGVILWRAGERDWRRVALILVIYFVGSSVITNTARWWTESTVNRAFERVQEWDDKAAEQERDKQDAEE